MAPKSIQQQEAADRYLKEKVEEFKVRIPKGKKGVVVSHAESQGESLNKFVIRAIDETMQRDKEAPDGK